jgi:hypothetical protein
LSTAATLPEAEDWKAKDDGKGQSLADDILEGADRIASFLFGDPKQRRRVYWLAEKRSLPVFRLGQLLCARKSKLLEFIEQQEAGGLKE